MSIATPGREDDHREYEAALRQEFIDMAADRLADLDEVIEAAKDGSADGPGSIRLIRRTAHNLKGMGGSFGFPVITSVAHRLENYLTDLDDLNADHLRNVQVYVDVMTDIITTRRALSDDQIQDIVRKLPPKPGFDVSDVVVSEVEVMLAMPGAAASHYVTQQLQECGYRVVRVSSPFEVLEQVVRTQPDLLLVSAVMDGLSGMDLASAIHAMVATRDLKVALLTSLDLDDPHLLELPEGVPVIRKGPEFGDDLAEALTILGIT